MSSDGKVTVMNINIFNNEVNTCYINIIIQILTSFSFVRKSIITMNITGLYSKLNTVEDSEEGVNNITGCGFISSGCV